MQKNNANKQWSIWGSSVTGPLHLKSGLPNQDAWLAKRHRWGEVVAVADGLGSKPHSDIGSQAVCKSVLDAARYFITLPDAEIKKLPNLIHSCWLLNIGHYAPSECATTCIFAIRQNECLILGQLGDGVLVVLGQSADSDFILKDVSEMGFSNLTDCMSLEYSAKNWTMRRMPVENVAGIVLCTDGIADDLIPDCRIDFARSICENYRDVPAKKRKQEIHDCLTNWTVPCHTDDKTIVCLYR